MDPVGTTHLRVDLYDTTQQAYPNLTLYDWESSGAEFDLNTLNFADKAARIVMTEGSAYVAGDSVTLFDEYNHPGTATWTAQLTSTVTDVDLNTVGFADRAASLRITTLAPALPTMVVAIQPSTAPIPPAMRMYVVSATDAKAHGPIQGEVWIGGTSVAPTGVPFEYTFLVGFRIVGPPSDRQVLPVPVAVTVKAPGYADGSFLVEPG